MKHKPRCKVRCNFCQCTGFDQIGYSFNKPKFQCQQCKRYWTCGYDGEPYFSYAQSYSNKVIE